MRLTTTTLTALCVVAFNLSGCGAPTKLSASQLDAMGVRDGVPHWMAQQKLSQEGYGCYVTGEARDDFNCVKTTGSFITCVFRITFKADDKNRVSNLRVSDPACIGTP